MTVSWGRLQKHADQRGYFAEVYRQTEDQFVQDNLSVSEFGVLRGFHCQKCNPQAKLVYVLSGEILDAWVDLRSKSGHFREAGSRKLSAMEWIYIPVGFAHAFQALDHNTMILYKCTSFYDPKDEAGVIWNDPDLKIKWPRTPIVSEKDQRLPNLKDAYTY